MSIARYSYLPFLRRGIAAAITQAPAAARAEIGVQLAVSDGTGAPTPVPQSFSVVGPGDVVGINPQMIIRTDPRPWITEFEPNYLPFVEFYDEDFPWRFTPAPADTASHRLAPWLFLLVLEEDEYEEDNRPGRPLPAIALTAKAAKPKLFPPFEQLWALAHVQVGDEIAAEGVTVPDLARLDASLRARPDSSLSRLMSPRRLKPDTAYSAFLIPTYEGGRKAGLGETVPEDASVRTPSWQSGGTFPVYHRWYFRTSDRGDFEELVRRLEPRVVDKRVGMRDLFDATPGFGMPRIANPAVTKQVPDAAAPGGTREVVVHPADTVGLEGALKATNLVPHGQTDPPAPGKRFDVEVAPILNQAADVEDASAGTQDPVITPPIYGRWHALARRVDPDAANRWLQQVNLDPRNRAAAGLGVRVVRENQETYMRRAWEQIGDVLAANRKLHGLQLAMEASQTLFSRHLTTLTVEEAAPVIAPVYRRVLGSPVTLARLLADSRLPSAALSPPMRRLLRPRGLLARRVFPSKGAVSPVGLVATAINEGKATAAPPRAPTGASTFEQVADDVELPDPDPHAVPWPKIGLIVAAALLLLFLLWGLFGFVVAFLLAAAFLAAVLYAFRKDILGPKPPSKTEAVDVGALTPGAVQAAPGPGSFAVPEPGQDPPVGTVAGSNDFRGAMAEFAGLLGLRPAPAPERRPFDMAGAHTKAIAALTPTTAFVKLAMVSVRVGDVPVTPYIGPSYLDKLGLPGRERIVPVMAYPDIKDAMYRPLSNLAKQNFVPNLDLIPRNTVTLLETNPPFIEAYMVGVNHEFGNELLWREYPTDQRGTPFRQFWEVLAVRPKPGETDAQRNERLKDIRPIHMWARASTLGSHDNRAAGARERIVLVIRGDLLRRYPNTVITAQKAVWRTVNPDGTGGPRLAVSDEDGTKVLANADDPDIKYPVLKAEVPDDLHFVGFDLTAETVRGAEGLDETQASRNRFSGDDLGWFFVIQEIPGEPRFGLDETSSPTATQPWWNNLAWTDLDMPDDRLDPTRPLKPVSGTNPAGGPAWGSHAADLAAILLQRPVMVAIHAKTMLPKDADNG